MLAFFERCKFPTEGVQSGEVDGESLVNLYQDPDAESIFTAPAPDGLGFNKLMFKGRFKKEMEKLVAKAVGVCLHLDSHVQNPILKRTEVR